MVELFDLFVPLFSSIERWFLFCLIEERKFFVVTCLSRQRLVCFLIVFLNNGNA